MNFREIPKQNSSQADIHTHTAQRRARECRTLCPTGLRRERVTTVADSRAARRREAGVGASPRAAAAAARAGASE